MVINTNALSWLAARQPFDVVFLDPPFRKGLLAETALLLEQRGWLADEAGSMVAEAESAAADACQLQLHREKVAGGGLSPLYSFAREKPTMLINLGRLLMLCVWASCSLTCSIRFPSR